MTITKPRKTMGLKTMNVLKSIAEAKTKRISLGTAQDEWRAKIIDNLAAAAYIKREPDGTYAITNKGLKVVKRGEDGIAQREERITNATTSARYNGHELTKQADRPGAEDFLAIPSRFNNTLCYRDGRVEAA
jgi:predicted transcriptional regulator